MCSEVTVSWFRAESENLNLSSATHWLCDFGVCLSLAVPYFFCLENGEIDSTYLGGLLRRANEMIHGKILVGRLQLALQTCRL